MQILAGADGHVSPSKYQRPGDEELADLLEEMPEQDQVRLLAGVGLERSADVVEEMQPDDAADLLGWQFGEQVRGVVRLHLFHYVGAALEPDAGQQPDLVLFGHLLQQVGRLRRAADTCWG